MSHHRSRRRHVVTKGGLTLPRTGLLLRIPLPNAYLPIDWDEELGWESPMLGYQATPGDDTLFAAAPQLYDGDADTPLILSDTDILALSGINTTVNGIEVSFSVAAGLAVRWYRIAYIPNAYPFVDRDGGSTRPFQGLQYIESDGTLQLINSGILGVEVVTREMGTASVTVASGKLIIGAGTLWSFALSNGASYEFATAFTSTTGIVFDNSGMGFNLTFSVADTTTVCKSGREYGSNLPDADGYSQRENLLGYALTGNDSYMYFSELDSEGFHTLRRLQNPSYSGISVKGHYDQYCDVNTYTFRFKARKTPGSTNLESEFSWYQGGKTGHTVNIISGPGTGSILGDGTIKLSTLSETVDTIVEITRNNFTVGAVFPVMTIYPGKTVSPSVGDSIRIGDVQIFQGATTRAYTPTLRVKYCTQIKTLTGLPISSEKIVCIGDSLSISYEQFLTTLFPNCTIVNAGVGGQITESFLNRFFTDVVNVGATQCIIVGGINDAAGRLPATTILSNINAMVAICKEHGIGVVVSDISPWRGFGGWHQDGQTILEEYNPLLHQYGIDNSIPIAKMYDALRTPGTAYVAPEFSSDGLHLSLAGSRRQAYILGNLLPMTMQDRDVYNNPIQYPGSAKQNITRTSGTGTNLSDTDTYTLPDSHTFRTSIGWTYGVDHWAFSDAGVPKEVSGATIKTNGVGPRWYVGTKGLALYSTDMDTAPADKDAKIKKYLKVPA